MHYKKTTNYSYSGKTLDRKPSCIRAPWSRHRRGIGHREGSSAATQPSLRSHANQRADEICFDTSDPSFNAYRFSKTMKSRLDNVQWARLLTVMTVAGICALSVHAILLQVFNVPFPDARFDAKLPRYFAKAICLFALIIFLRSAVANEQSSFLRRFAIAFLVYASLSEAILRAAFMEGYCTDAWLYAFIANLQRLVPLALASGMIAFASPKLDRVWKCCVAAVAISALVQFQLAPLTVSAFQGVMQSIAAYAPTGEWCKLPYGPDVLIPAYLTFVEPALGCLVAAALCWDQLAGGEVHRLIWFTLLIVALKNQLLTPFIYMAYAKMPALAALASEGQFALEAITLGAVTGAGWIFIRRTLLTKP